MGYLFIDIESFVDPDENMSGLNPFYAKSKVIVVSYNYYSSASAPQPGEVKAPTFLFEWVLGSEEKLLKEFYKIMEKIIEKDSFLKIVGFNHIAYDLPFLFSRMSHHKTASEKKLFDLLFTSPRHIDLSQLGMAVSKATKRDRDFRCISHKTINSLYDIPVKEADGKEVSLFYSKKQFDRIEKYCKDEFTFELLYQSLLETFLH